LQVTGQLYLGAAYLWTGDYRRAEDLFLTVVRLLDGERSRERFGLTTFPAVIARAYLTWCCTDGGEYERGIVHAEEAISLADVDFELSSLGLRRHKKVDTRSRKRLTPGAP